MVSEAENYFKHANRAESTQLKFYPEGTEYLIWDACIIYGSLTRENSALMLIFKAWFSIKHPEIISDEQAQKALIEIGQRLNPENRIEFLNLLPEFESRLVS